MAYEWVTNVFEKFCMARLTSPPKSAEIGPLSYRVYQLPEVPDDLSARVVQNKFCILRLSGISVR